MLRTAVLLPATLRCYCLFQKYLKLPSDRGVSRNAENLMMSLMSDIETRLCYDAIRVHAFFKNVDFDNIRHSEQTREC